jgi:hypothetical protein
MWAYWLWQLAEIAYFIGIWGYFVYLYEDVYNYPASSGYVGPITTGWYFAILAARLLTAALLGATMVKDMLQPERDLVRASGLNDDPAGGVLDGAPDRLVISWPRLGRQLAGAATN